MRIAFVGKGGSGKSTLAASFASYLSENTEKPVAVFDADLNIHAPELLGFAPLSHEQHLSHPSVEKDIKQWLIGDNDFPNLATFRKTTPPTRKSNILNLKKLQQSPLAPNGHHRDTLSVFAVGTYQEDDIGASCYHNSLAIFESLLNHTDDKDGYVVADMVAGVDSFAGTLHAQFDLTCLIVEPTKRSIEVYEKYKSLAQEAGTLENLRVIGNKVRNETDIAFIQTHCDEKTVLGYFADDDHIRHIDQTGEPLAATKLDPHNQKLLASIATILDSLPDSRDIRLQKIWELHKKYVSQGFIVGRFGDLTTQIDTEFSYLKSET